MKRKTSWLLLGAIALILSAATVSAADLLDPASLNETAPDQFQVKFETTKGDIVIQVEREWAPIGADRFYNLSKSGFFNDTRFFRIVPNFVVQWGINGDPAVSAKWKTAGIQDEPVRQSNARGTVTFAKSSAPNSRTTQLFINTKANGRLDGMGFAPFGTVVEGMDVVAKLYPGYGQSPNQALIQSQGTSYLMKNFPELDFIKNTVVTKTGGGKPAEEASDSKGN